MRVAIAPTSGPVPLCVPNLMPFHINHNGPAAINAYMHFRKLVDNVEQEVNATPESLEASVVVNDSTTTDVGTSSKETQGLRVVASSDDIETPSCSMTRTTSASTLITDTELSSNKPSPIPDVAMSTPQCLNDLEIFTQPIEDLDKRFVSTFRGRSIYGLSIDLPTGYTGVVLNATTNDLAKAAFEGNQNIHFSGGNTGRGAIDNDMDVEEEESGWERRQQRRRGRFRSSAAPRKGTVIDISEEDNTSKSVKSFDLTEGDGDEIDESLGTMLPEDNDPIRRNLVPTARFDSFTLWQADRSVNKNNDEYCRTLTEWIGLAHEIHNTEI